MLQNKDEKIDNKNRKQYQEISRKNNLSIDFPSFIPNNLKKCNNSNDNSNNNVNIRLNEYLIYFSHPQTQECKYNGKDKNKDSRNIVLNINAKEYIPKNKRENEDSKKKRIF